MLNPRKLLVKIVLLLLISTLLTGFVYAEPNRTGTITADHLNMRELPSTSSESITKIPQNERIQVTDQQGYWYKVIYESVTGWVHSQYVCIIGENTCLGIVNADNVNIRAFSGLSYLVQDRLDRGQKVKVISYSDEWYNIEYDGEKGWIYGKYLSVVGEAVCEGVVNAQNVNIRSNPNLSSDIMRKSDKFEEVSIFGVAGDWYIVRMQEGEFGWIFDKYITLTQSNISRSGEQLFIREVDTQTVSTIQQQIVEYAKKFMGVRYVWGGSTPRGFDCSGYVQYVYRYFGVNLLHNAALQSKSGTWVKRSDLRHGDLVFFDTDGGNNNISHVGMYIGDGNFIHASSSVTYGKKVRISSLTSAYYSNAYMTARRYVW